LARNLSLASGLQGWPRLRRQRAPGSPGVKDPPAQRRCGAALPGCSVCVYEGIRERGEVRSLNAAAVLRTPPEGERGQSVEYVPALDGLRAVFVACVVAFHLGLRGASGLYMGVDGFFVLSGFLITLLLIADWDRSGAISLGRFYARRIRRLLPALCVLLMVVAIGEGLFGNPADHASIAREVLATLFYSSNWYFVATHSGYFGKMASASPLAHTWSLAIEEQFYIVWPLVLRALLRRFTRSQAAILAGAGAVGSALAMWCSYQGGRGLDEAYYGTECRAQALLVGCALALVLREVEARPALCRCLSLLSYPAAAGAALIWASAGGPAPLMFSGGFLLSALCVAAAMAGIAVSRRNALRAVLSLPPLVGIGKISYGIYLWMYPITQLFNAADTGYSGLALARLRLVAILIMALASYFLVERPIRSGGYLKGAKAWVAGAGALTGVVASSLTVGSLTPLPVGRSSAAPAPGSASLASYKGPAVRVFFAGDSISLTLAAGLQEVQDRYHVLVRNGAVFGCGMVSDGRVRLYGLEGYPGGAPGACARELAAYRDQLEAFAPDVVVLLAGRMETADWTFGAGWEHIGEPDFDARVAGGLRSLLLELHATGAPVVVLTCPYFGLHYQLDGRPYPEDDPSRVDRLNELIREVAVGMEPWLHVIDLNKEVDPGGAFAEYIDGYQVRAPDGVHFSYPPSLRDPGRRYPAGGRWLAPWLLPQLFEIGLGYLGSGS
jgi:peptidoglycan/LPS O-acetylase OafA/YrhL